MTDSIEEMADSDDENFIDKPLEYNIEEFCKNLIKVRDELPNEKKRLESKLRKICKALTDINHKLELTPKMSASYRCKLSILESELYQKRREVKDRIFYIDCVFSYLDGEVPNIKDERRYVPRLLDDLFEGKEIPKIEDILLDN